MKKISRWSSVLWAVSFVLLSDIPITIAGTTSENISALKRELTRHSSASHTLRSLTDIGHRLGGSPGLEAAIGWAKGMMDSYGLENIHLQPVTIGKWVRGDVETAKMKLGTDALGDLEVVALGPSVGTSESGIQTGIVEVHSLDELVARKTEVSGKIVFFNGPMDGSLDNPLEAYDLAVKQRSSGAVKALENGAVAVLVRSITSLDNDHHPHTGWVNYQDTPEEKKIPAAALSTYSANILFAKLRENPLLEIHLTLSAHSEGIVQSYNVMGDLKGTSLKDEIVVLGAHLDSWDLATGAQDDGAGVTHVFETIRAFRTLGLTTKRTIRFVLFTDEEISAEGGIQFMENSKANGDQIVLALESDLGGSAPMGYMFQTGDSCSAKGDFFSSKYPSWTPYLNGASSLRTGDSGVDIEPLTELKVGTIAVGYVPVLKGYLPSRNYFDIHHSALDTFDSVNPDELIAGAVSIASFIYLAAEKLVF